MAWPESGFSPERLFYAVRAPAHRGKVWLYQHKLNSLDFIWEYRCWPCGRVFQGRDPGELGVEVLLHTHHRGPSRPWHPRYTAPPRW